MSLRMWRWCGNHLPSSEVASGEMSGMITTHREMEIEKTRTQSIETEEGKRTCDIRFVVVSKNRNEVL